MSGDIRHLQIQPLIILVLVMNDGAIHFEFWTLEIRLRFARDPTSLLTPPFRNPDIWTMRESGTTSWFLEPIST